MSGSDFERICQAFEEGVRRRKNQTATQAGMAAALREMSKPGSKVVAAGCERVGSTQYAETVLQAMLDELLRQAGEQEEVEE